MADAVQSAVDLYAQPLYGLDGFFQAVPNARRADFDTFVAGMHLKKTRSNVFSLGYIERIQPGYLSLFEQRMRADGYKNFSVPSEKTAGDRYIIRHLYMKEGERAPAQIAFDFAKDATRFAAITAARDTDDRAITSPLTLRTSTGDRRGFVMFLPVYAPQAPHESLNDRRANIRGVVSVVFKADQFFPSALQGVGISERMRLYVHDPSETKLGAGDLYLHDAEIDPKRHLSAEREVRVADHTWKLVIAVPQDYSMSLFERVAPYVFLVRNMLFAIGLPIALYLLVLLRYKTQETLKRGEGS